MTNQLPKPEFSVDALTDAVSKVASGDEAARAEATRQLDAVAHRAEAGDEDAMSVLRQVMDAFPGLWQTFGNLARGAEDAQLKMVAGQNLPLREGLQRRLKEMRADLAGPGSSPLEALLAERIALCWLQLQYADAIYAQRAKNLDLRWGEFHQRRQDRAHRRFLSACKTLATVRKLLKPQIAQVNIGVQQVNVAQAGANTANLSDAGPVTAAAANAARSLPQVVTESAEGGDRVHGDDSRARQTAGRGMTL